MLLPSMSSKEIYDHILDDLEKIHIRQEYLLPKAIKEFKKERRFPAWKWYEYIIPATKNKHIIFFYAESRMFIERPKVDFFTIIFDKKNRFVIKATVGGYKHTEKTPIRGVRHIHVFSSHFIERYNERLLKDKSLNANDIICRYFSRNTISIPIQMNEGINRKLEKYGESAKYGYRVRDGFCFVRSRIEGIMSEDGDRTKDKIEALLVVYTTFMNETNMATSQLSAINEGHYNTWEQFFRIFLEKENDGVVKLSIEP